MEIGRQIAELRKKQGLTQEAFGERFHVTRQTVSNWENGKSYPELQTLVELSEYFEISLDVLLKENLKMVKEMDKDREVGRMRHEKSVMDMATGMGTGLLISCLFAPDSLRRNIVIGVGLALLCVGWYKQALYDRKILRILKEKDEEK